MLLPKRMPLLWKGTNFNIQSILEKPWMKCVTIKEETEKQKCSRIDEERERQERELTKKNKDKASLRA